MNHDPQLIDTIKWHFARKSSAQLQEIVQAENQDRWSAEAIAAAGELLQDRMAGRAQEPQVAEVERPPPRSSPDPYNLAFIYGLLAISPLAAVGFMALSGYAARDEDNSASDLPIPFGPKTAWLALDTTDTEAVANALGLRDARTATWGEGLKAASQPSLFVTPPLADWTLVVGTALFPPERADTFVKPLVERLSRQFGDAQYFCTHRDIELHIWARAVKGRLVRGYGWLGEKGLTLWDEGAPTTTETRDLRLRFVELRSPGVGQDRQKDLSLPDESCVMELAALWSIDPTILDEQFREPVMGLLGSVAWDEGRTKR
jgi:hypothetical protein